MSDLVENKPKKKRRIWVWIFVLLVILLLLYFYTYFFANKNGKVIYQDSTRRLYLIKRGPYGKPDREMWRMVYEDMKGGGRWFITGNSRKGYPNKKMAERVLNTVDQGKTKSYDAVDSVGLTIIPVKTDVHSNLIDKKGLGDFWPDEKEFDNLFPVN